MKLLAFSDVHLDSKFVRGRPYVSRRQRKRLRDLPRRRRRHSRRLNGGRDVPFYNPRAMLAPVPSSALSALPFSVASSECAVRRADSRI